MKLLDARISNCRSIKDEQSIIFDVSTTLIGPNNSGKTNALRAVALLFGGYDNKFLYDREKDLPVDRPTKQTSVIGTFEIQPEEKWFWEKFQPKGSVSIPAIWARTITPLASPPPGAAR